MKKRSFKNKRLLALLLLPAFLLAAVLFALAHSAVTAQAQSQPGTLEDSWVMDINGNWVSSVGWDDTVGYWDDDWSNYNCYAYAIGKTDGCLYPGQYDPGIVMNISNKQEFINYMKGHTIEDMAAYVKTDLIALGGYGDVYITTVDPDIVEPYQTKICIRRSTELTTSEYWQEFHFMKYVSDAWYHKPGLSAILKYKYQNPGNQDWYSESSFFPEEDSSESFSHNYQDLVDYYDKIRLYSPWIPNRFDCVYDSPIYYIVYGSTPFTASLSGGNVTITGVKQGIALAGSVKIPSTMYIGGGVYPVTAIGNYAFMSQRNLASVTIPATVANIGVEAFADCDGLVIHAEAAGKPAGWSVYWNSLACPVYWGVCGANFVELNGAQYYLQGPDAVLTRYAGAESAFGIPSTVEIDNVSRSVAMIGVSAFQDASCNQVRIPASVTDIARDAFKNCAGLSSVYVERQAPGITALGVNAFFGCGNFTIYVPAASINEYRRVTGSWRHYYLDITYDVFDYSRDLGYGPYNGGYLVGKGSADTDGYVFIPETHPVDGKPIFGVE